MTCTTDEIKDRLDDILRDYLSTDAQIQAGLTNGSGFFGSEKYYELQHIKDDLLTAHRKLTDALVAIEQYM